MAKKIKTPLIPAVSQSKVPLDYLDFLNSLKSRMLLYFPQALDTLICFLNNVRPLLHKDSFNCFYLKTPKLKF